MQSLQHNGLKVFSGGIRVQLAPQETTESCYGKIRGHIHIQDRTLLQIAHPCPYPSTCSGRCREHDAFFTIGV
jgi:hypothetical protein